MMADAMQQFCPEIPFVTEYLLDSLPLEFTISSW